MGKDKAVKTNAMRILDRENIPYRVNYYECDEFIDGIHIADMLSQPYEISFKTLVTEGKNGEHFVFVLPVDRELDMKKCASCVGQKSVEMIHVKDIKNITGYIRGGCSPVGMKKLFVTVIDSSAEKFPEIIISGGMIGAQIFIEPKELLKATKGKYGEIVKEQTITD